LWDCPEDEAQQSAAEALPGNRRDGLELGGAKNVRDSSSIPSEAAKALMVCHGAQDPGQMETRPLLGVMIWRIALQKSHVMHTNVHIFLHTTTGIITDRNSSHLTRPRKSSEQPWEILNEI
jgi:hypothetical protein